MASLWQQFCCNVGRNSTLEMVPKYDGSFIDDFLYYVNTYVWDKDEHDFNKCFEKLIFIIVPHILAIIVQAYNYGRLNYKNLKKYLPKFKRTHPSLNNPQELNAQPLNKWLYFKYHKSWWLAFSFTSGVMITWCAMHALFQSTLYYTTTTEATILTTTHNSYPTTTKMTYWLTVHSVCLVTMIIFWFSRLLLCRHTNIFPTPPPSLLINKKPNNIPVKSFVCWYTKLIFIAPFFRQSTSYDLMSDLKPLLGLIRAGFIIIVAGLPFLHSSLREAISAYQIHRSEQLFGETTPYPSNNPRPIIQVVETGFVMSYFVVLTTQLTILLSLLYRYIARFKQTELQFATGTSSPTSTSQHSSSISSGCSTSSTHDPARALLIQPKNATEKCPLLDEQSSYGTLGRDVEAAVHVTDNSVHQPPGWYSTLTLGYVSPSLKLIRVFGLSDPNRSLLPLPPSLSSSNTSSSGSGRNTLVRLVKTTLGAKFLALGAVKFLNDLVGLACPLLLNKLIASLSPSATSHLTQTESILAYGMGLAGAVLLSTFLTVHFDYQLGLLALKTKSAIVNHLYGSVMTASLSDIAGVKIASAHQNENKKKKEKNGFVDKNQPEVEESSSIQGSILSMLSTDVDRIVNFCSSFHACWSLPLQILASLYLLYTQVGLTFLIGVVMVLAMIPINRCLAVRISTYSSGMLSAKDARLRLITYMLNAWRSVKALGLERYFTARVTEARERELIYVRRQKYLDALCVYFWATTPVIMSVSTFITYVLYQQWNATAKSGGPGASFTLDAAKIFTSLALFNMLILPLNSLPWVINGLVEAWISLRRVQSLLSGLRSNDQSELSGIVESNSNYSEDELPVEKILILERCSFRWSTSNLSISPDLRDVSIKIDLGRPALIGITGPIGSGKSSLLLALMNEMTLVDGVFVVETNDSKNLKSSKSTAMKNVGPGTLKISYSGQKPWIQSASIRSNILFGNDYDPVRYARVLDALKLNEDLESMPNNDLTIVGECGTSTLSGGQQTRISLARALYQKADIYLLDEPLASLDNVVGSWVFERAIKQFLGRKIVVIATHLTRHLANTDVLWTMDNGSLYVSCRSGSGPLPDKNIALIEGFYDEPVDLPTLTVTEGGMEKPTYSNTRDNRIIDASIFNYYVKSMGLALFIIIMVCFTFMQLTRNGCDWWLAYYHFDSGNATQPHLELTHLNNNGPHFLSYHTYTMLHGSFPTLSPSIRLFLIVYAALGLSNSIFTLLRSFLFAYGGVKAARSCHATLFRAVIRAKASNFWQTQAPHQAHSLNSDDSEEMGHGGSLVSRLVNRFSADTYTIDNNLPFMSNILLAQIFGLIGTLVVGLWAQPWLGPLILPLSFVFYADLQAYYRTASREIKRWEASTRAPLLSRFEQSLRGKQYVRNFPPPSSTPRVTNAKPTMPALTSLPRFEAEYALTIDTHIRACYNNLALSQWLNLRLQLFGVVFIVALVAIIALQTGLSAFIIAPDANYKPYSSLTSTSSGMLGLALSYFLVITGKLASLITVAVECEKEFISVERIKECADGLSLEEVDPEHEGGGTMGSVDGLPTSLTNISHGEIRFDNVSVRYYDPVSLGHDDDDESETLLNDDAYTSHPKAEGPPLALKNASFIIHPTEKIGIVGRTGAGKSTIFSVILKLVDLQDNLDKTALLNGGDIKKSALYINGIDLAHIRPDILRSEMISLVPQEPFLIPGSLRLNLDPGGKFSDFAICQKLLEAGLYQKVILDMGGLDRPVMTNHESSPNLAGENCVGKQFYGELSLGQQQVISLARVVVNKNKIILIDEPTSNVDKETQDILTDCIFHRAFAPCTVVVIAHRLETLKSCDRIMVLEKGRVIEFASPNQLISDPNSKFSSFAKGVWSL